MPRPDVWHRKSYIHPIQRKYFYPSLAPLIVCSVAIIAMAFLIRGRDRTGAAREQVANLQGRLPADEIPASSVSTDLVTPV